GNVAVDVDSFGRSGHGPDQPGAGFDVGEGPLFPNSVLYQHADYISIGGAGMQVNPVNCRIVTAITLDPSDSNHATSSVECGPIGSGCVIGFDQRISTVAAGAGEWRTTVDFTSCAAVACYYTYTDFDVHGFANNESVVKDRGDGFFAFVDHN